MKTFPISAVTLFFVFVDFNSNMNISKLQQILRIENIYHEKF